MSLKSPQLQSANSPGAKPGAAGPASPDADKPARKKKKKPPAEKKSDQSFVDGYQYAYGLIYEQQNYADGIAALRSLERDDHPDVANLIGYASRKLGRTEDAKAWYERALAGDPKHTRTWQYYGMWQLEMGERAKAEEYLERICLICGSCEDYASLRDAIDGNIVY